MLAALGRLYLEAELAVESNNHGHATLDALHNTLNYSPLYRYRRYDQSGLAGEALGWPTNARTKPLMIDELGEAIAEGHLLIHSVGVERRWNRLSEALRLWELRWRADGQGRGAPEIPHMLAGLTVGVPPACAWLLS